MAPVDSEVVGRPTASILPILAGLLAAASFAASAGWPPTHFLSWGQLVGAAAQRVLSAEVRLVLEKPK
ncbi:MAG TPA: hypothetical protein VGK96_07420 [Candidatus Sulfotelmatobacter sp.]